MHRGLPIGHDVVDVGQFHVGVAVVVLRPAKVDARANDVLRVEVLVVNVQRVDRAGNVNGACAVMLLNEENGDHHRESEIDQPDGDEKDRKAEVETLGSAPVRYVLGLDAVAKEEVEIVELPDGDQNGEERLEQRRHFEPAVAAQIHVEDDGDLRNLLADGPAQIDRVRTNAKALFGFQAAAAEDQKDQLCTSDDDAD